MDQPLMEEVKEVVFNIVGNDMDAEKIDNDFQLAGNVLDSMAVTNLILALEEYFDVIFEDDDLSVESFETVFSLYQLVEKKLNTNNA